MGALLILLKRHRKALGHPFKFTFLIGTLLSVPSLQSMSGESISYARSDNGAGAAAVKRSVAQAPNAPVSNAEEKMVRLLATLLGSITLLLASSSAKSEDVPDALAVEWQGKKPCENLHEDNQIRILRCIFAPGAVHVRHSHPAAFTYVLSGGKVQMQSDAGTGQRDIGSDNFVNSPPVSWHEATNVGDTTLRFLIVEKKY